MRAWIALLAVGTAVGLGLICVGFGPLGWPAFGAGALLLGAALAGLCSAALILTLTRRSPARVVFLLAAGCGALAVLGIAIGLLTTPQVLGLPRRYAVYSPAVAGPAFDPIVLLAVGAATGAALTTAAGTAMLAVLAELARRGAAVHRSRHP